MIELARYMLQRKALRKILQGICKNKKDNKMNESLSTNFSGGGLICLLFSTVQVHIYEEMTLNLNNGSTNHACTSS